MEAQNLLTGMTVSIFITAVILTVPITFGLQWLYRQAVIKGMKTHTDREQEVERPHLPDSTQKKPQLSYVWLTPKSGASTNPWFQKIGREQRRLTLAYGLAGLVFVIIFVLTELVSTSINIQPGRFTLLVIIFAWPLVFTTNMMVVRDQITSLTYTASYAIIFSLFVMIVIFLKLSNGSLWDFWGTWFFFNLPPYLFLQFIISRPVRSVGPIVFTMMLIIAAGMIIPLTILGSFELEYVFNSIYNFIALFGMQSLIFVIFFASFILGGVFFAAPIGWLFLHILGNQYRHKKTSDQFILFDLTWLIYAYYWAIVQVSNGPIWVFTGAIAFLAYKFTLWLGLHFIKRGSDSVPELLLLRVFSLGKRSENFYDAFSKFWRYMGTICFITGPDLLKTTIQPHRFLDFLSGKLSSNFINDQSALDRRMKELDRIPDLDGRYRINDFFCRDNTWKMVLKRLAINSDLILMDLRSFSNRNAGCQFEINALFQMVPLRRVVFVVDRTTDQEFLGQTMQGAWNSLSADSPNTLGDGRVFFFSYHGARWRDLRQLLQATTEMISI